MTPGSSIHGISQARILEWVAIFFSKGSSWPIDWIHISYTDRQVLYHWAIGEAYGVADIFQVLSFRQFSYMWTSYLLYKQDHSYAST